MADDFCETNRRLTKSVACMDQEAGEFRRNAATKKKPPAKAGGK
jgi:hypothetical protein